jgi:hypothetical protein
VAQLRETSRALLALMYRAHCPSPEVLGQYQLNLLSPAEKLKVAAHVRACPHCTRELQALEMPEDELIHRVCRVLHGVRDIIEAALVASPLPSPAGVRGRAGQRYAFRGGGLDVLIGFEPAARPSAPGLLTGAVLQADRIAEAQAWLFQEGDNPRATKVDALGTFTFEKVKPGAYDLALTVGEDALLLREVIVGDA